MRKAFDGEWFTGSVQGHRTTTLGSYNWIVYQDGDPEEMTNAEVANHLYAVAAEREQAAINAEQSSADQPIPIKSENDLHAATAEQSMMDEVNPIPIKSDFTAEQTGDSPLISSTVSATVRPITSSATALGATAPVPDRAPLSRTTATVLEDFDVDSKVKVEGKKVKLKDEVLKRITDVTTNWIAANRDPETGQGRFVFRKGCHEKCITKLLGGCGTEVFPLCNMKPDHEFYGRFIQNGEFYAAGNELFNPFGPRFPGDPGLVDVEHRERNPDQEEFHMFIQCGGKPLSRLWQGRSARGARMVGEG